MKKFICGLLAGTILTGGIAFGVSYVANPVDFKVLVNGKEFVSDPPALEVEGRTYLPLRAMGDALGVPVNWNEELRQAEVGNSAPIAEANEYSRSNPAPLNTVQTYTKNDKYSTNNYSAAIRITEVLRGEDAWGKIKEANMFNDEADEGYEYVLAKIAFSVLSVTDDNAFDVDYANFYFKAFSSNNEEMPSISVVKPEPKLSGKLYAGGNTEGWVAFQVKTDDANPKLAYGLDYNGAGGVWFALQ